MTEPEQTADAVARPSEIPLGVVIALAAAVAFAYTFSLGMGALAEPDEPRYAEIAREMLARHDWVTPTLNYVKYFEKPPLVYWLNMIVFRCFGFSDTLARAVPVACTLCTLVLTGIIGRQLYDRWVAVVAVAVLAASPLMLAMGQTLTLDPALTLTLTAALVCFWFGYHDAARRPRLYRTMYVFVALAVLVKGPVAIVLSGATVAGFLLTRLDGRALLRVLDPVGLALFAAVALPWFVLVSVRNPEFLNFFVMDQHLKRFLSPEEHRQGIWFFLPFAFAGVMPWSIGLLMIPAEWRALARWRTWSPGTWFCLIWAAVIIGFFSLSASKLATYILPALPPLALLCARALQRIVAGNAPFASRLGVFFTYLGWAMAAGGVGVGSAVLLQRADLVHVDPELAQILTRIVVPLFAGGGAMVLTGWLLGRSESAPRGLAIAAGGWLVLMCAAMAGRDATTSYRALGRAIHANIQPTDQVVIYHHYVQGIPLYSERRAVLVGARGELAFGAEQGDQRDFFWPQDQRLIEAWASATRLFLVINRSELEPLRPQLSSTPIEIAAEGKKVVVINHPLG